MASTDIDTFGWVADANNALNAPHAEYFRKNRWVIEFNLPAQLAAVTGAADSLRLNLMTAARPKISFEETEIHRINGKNYLAGKPEFEAMTVGFYDNLPIGIPGEPNLSVSAIMEAWRQLIYQPTQGDAFGSVANYKGSASLNMLGPQGLTPDILGEGVNNPPIPSTDFVIQQWAVIGMFPQAIDYSELDYSSSEAQMVEVTFRFDRAWMVLQQPTAPPAAT